MSQNDSARFVKLCTKLTYGILVAMNVIGYVMVMLVVMDARWQSSMTGPAEALQEESEAHG